MKCTFAKFAVTSMTPQKVIPTVASSQEQLLRIFPMIGYAPSVA